MRSLTDPGTVPASKDPRPARYSFLTPGRGPRPPLPIPVWSAMPTWLRRAIIFLAIVGIWEAYVLLAHVSRLLFASPSDVGRAFVDGWASGLLATSTGVTIEQLAIAMGIGIAVTLVFSTVAITTRFGDDLMSLLSSMINPLPSVAILPLAILWFGLNSTSIILVTA